MKIINTGVTRHVILIGKYAIKIPRLNYGWPLFLGGLLCNMQETNFSTIQDIRLCPVILSAPGGWFIVMPRCEPLTENEFAHVRVSRFKPTEGLQIPVEHKRDSFGWYKRNGVNREVVAVDYGS